GMLKIRAVRVFGLLWSLGLLGLPITGWAQGPPEARTFGVTASVSHTLQALAFTGDNGSTNLNVVTDASTQARYCAGTTSCTLGAAALLPAGALITSIELEGCATPTTTVLVNVLVRRGTTSTASLLADTELSSTSAGTCARAVADLPITHTV